MKRNGPRVVEGRFEPLRPRFSTLRRATHAGAATASYRQRMEDRAMTVITAILTWLVSAAVAFAAAQDTAAKPQRFDYLVRADFFAGAAGDDARLQKAIDVCERALAANPQHPEAMVWHGATVLVRASQAFQKGDAANGRPLFEKGVKEMSDAV